MHYMNNKYDFGGYVTKNNILCSDGRVIRQDAFAHQDKTKVPLVWQHMRQDPENILGHVILENRPDGVYGYASFNNTKKAQLAKASVEHGDVDSLSIFANQLQQNNSNVIHGQIREVSLVVSGANPGATIDNITIQHGDGMEIESEEEAIMVFGEKLQHNDEHDIDSEDLIYDDIYEDMSEEQKDAVAYIAGMVLKDQEEEMLSLQQSEGGMLMKKNVFDQNGSDSLTHANTFDREGFAKAVFEDVNVSKSFKRSFLSHAEEFGLEVIQHDGVAGVDYGIKNIELLFPEFQNVNGQAPAFVKRRTEWVNDVISNTTHVPFSRIKSRTADITAEEARARGYVTGKKKLEEVISIAKRETTAQTIYKKQKLDRDDLLEITDFNVVSWLQAEMKIMYEEELARAILCADGRLTSDDSKIKEDRIRPIWKDDLLFTTRTVIEKEADGTIDPSKVEDQIIRSFEQYEGMGNTTLYTTLSFINDMLLQKDKMGRRLYRTKQELADTLGVSKIVDVPVMKGVTGEVTILENDVETTADVSLLGVIVNINDYTVGATKGGALTSFEQFDIDYNQLKYLIEGRQSGALTLPKTAIALVVKNTEVLG